MHIPASSVVTLSGVDEILISACTASTVIEYSVDTLRLEIVGEVELVDSVLLSGELKQFPSLVRVTMYSSTSGCPGRNKNIVRDVGVRDTNVRLNGTSQSVIM